MAFNREWMRKKAAELDAKREFIGTSSWKRGECQNNSHFCRKPAETLPPRTFRNAVGNWRRAAATGSARRGRWLAAKI